MVADYRSSGGYGNCDMQCGGTMNPRPFLTAAAALAIPFGALAAEQPAESPQATAAESVQSAPNASETIVKLMQEKLHQLGLYTGPIDGDLSGGTQAALVQFQLSVPIPASGTLDDATMAALGLERETQAAAGASLVPASPEKKDAGG
jgi:peptidoglycan hydrolase-like protein with peptidoglycan-binding domain